MNTTTNFTTSSVPFNFSDRNRERKMVFYGRVSTEHEAQLSALENQIQWYDDQAKYHANWTVVDKYIDEGITGTQAKKRPAFMKMIADAKEGKFDLIVTREVCRFARNTVDTLVATRELKNYGVEVYFVEDNIWTMDGDGELRLSLMATLAQDESRKISERVRAGQKISRDNGVLYGSGNIIGYDRVDGTYVINPNQAETIRIVFDLYLQGLGEKKIVNELCRLKRLDGHGKVSWSTSKISRILRNATYKGYKCYLKSQSNNYLEQKRIKNNDESTYMYVKGDFEPIVSEEVWDKCNEIRQSRTTTVWDSKGKPQKFGKISSKDIWMHKLRCHCGSSFKKCKWRTNKRGDEVFGYQCYNQANNGSKAFREKNGLSTEGYCEIKMVGDWKLDMMAKKIIEGIWTDRKSAVMEAYRMINDCFQPDTANNKAAVAALDGKIAKLKNKIEGIISMRAEGEISKDEYTSLKAKLDSELSVLITEKETTTKNEDSDVPKLDIEAIKKVLNECIDFSKPQISQDIIGKLVSNVTPLDNCKFRWDMNFLPNELHSISCSIEGRKTSATVTVDEDGDDTPPFTYIFSLYYSNIKSEVKNAYQGTVLHRLHSNLANKNKFI